MGLLLLLSGALLSEKSKINESLIFGCGALFFFGCAPFCEQVRWTERLPAPIAAYFYSGSGSLFPLFPWAGYVMFGGALGAYLARAGTLKEPFRMCRRLAVMGTASLALYYCSSQLKGAGYGSNDFWASPPDLPLLRLGTALLLIIPLALLSSKIRALPSTLLRLGRRTLPIYVAHLIILYGSPWNPGLNRVCDRCLPPWPAIFAALLMQVVMIGFAMVNFERTKTVSGAANPKASALTPNSPIGREADPNI